MPGRKWLGLCHLFVVGVRTIRGPTRRVPPTFPACPGTEIPLKKATLDLLTHKSSWRGKLSLADYLPDNFNQLSVIFVVRAACSHRV
jgi:hypothetical protein